MFTAEIKVLTNTPGITWQIKPDDLKFLVSDMKYMFLHLRSLTEIEGS